MMSLAIQKPDGGFYKTIDVPENRIFDGIALHKGNLIDPAWKGYQLTHIATGMRLASLYNVPNCETVKQMEKLAAILSKITDWSKVTKQNVTPGLARSVRETIEG